MYLTMGPERTAQQQWLHRERASETQATATWEGVASYDGTALPLQG